MIEKLLEQQQQYLTSKFAYAKELENIGRPIIDLPHLKINRKILFKKIKLNYIYFFTYLMLSNVILLSLIQNIKKLIIL